MSHAPHTLSDKFPYDAQKNHLETNIEPARDEALEDLKKRHLALLDEISSYIAT